MMLIIKGFVWAGEKMSFMFFANPKLSKNLLGQSRSMPLL